MNRRLISLLFFFLLFTTPVLAEFQPKPYAAVYSLSKAGIPVGETTVTLAKDTAGNWVYTSFTKTTGMAAMFLDDTVTEQTIFRIKDQKVQTLEYSYTHSGKPRKNRKLVFDWKTMTAQEKVAEQKWKLNLDSNTLDKHVYRYALMMDLENRYENIYYNITDDSKIEPYHFTQQDIVEMDTSFGKLNAQKVLMERDNKTSIQFWCAKELGYLPVRVEKDSEKNGNLTMKLISVSGEYFSAQYQPLQEK